MELKFQQNLLTAVLATGCMIMPVKSNTAYASPEIFKNISGSWKGAGLVKATAKGKQESIRCRMKNTHKPDSSRLDLSGNCAVSGFVFSLRGWIQQSGSKNSYRASMFQSLANLKQSTFSGKRSGSRINFSFKARDRISKSDIKATIRVASKGASAFDVQVSRTDPASGKIFNVGTIKFKKK